MALAIIMLPVWAQAITLDWSSASISWTAGALTASFNTDASNPGNDITVTITGNTSRFQSGAPSINQDNLTGTDALDLFLDFSSDSQSVTVSVAFNYAAGVTNVSLTLFDVDEGTVTGKGKSATATFDDQISSIRATNTSGGLVAATITTSADNSKSGTGTNVVVVGTDSNNQNSTDGNLGISFGTNAITGFTFTYGNDSSVSQSNPDQQGIGLGNIDYSPVGRKLPEKGTFLAIAFTGVGCLLLRRRRKLAPS